jgi:archaellum component FlaC
MVNDVDHEIDSIENKIKNVGDKYNKISQKVSNVKNLQLDSFLLNKLK